MPTFASRPRCRPGRWRPRCSLDQGLHVDSIVVRGPALRSARIRPARTRRSCSARRFQAKQLAGVGLPDHRAFAERPRSPASTARGCRAHPRVFRMAADRGESFRRSIQIALTTVLASPRFLFLVEPEDADRKAKPNSSSPPACRISSGAACRTRRLFRGLRAGTLRANLRVGQVVHMLADPRSQAFVEISPARWRTQLHSCRRCARRGSSASSTTGYASAMRPKPSSSSHVLRTSRSVLELLDSRLHVRERIARETLRDRGGRGRRVPASVLADRRRGGVLTQASVLTLTSSPNRTSPVKRGQVDLAADSGNATAATAAGGAIDESRQAADALAPRAWNCTRGKAECARLPPANGPLGFTCSKTLTPWGDGGLRTADSRSSSGELLGGQKVADITELKKLLQLDRRQEIHAVSHREYVNLWSRQGTEHTTIAVEEIVQGLQ